MNEWSLKERMKEHTNEQSRSFFYCYVPGHTGSSASLQLGLELQKRGPFCMEGKGCGGGDVKAFWSRKDLGSRPGMANTTHQLLGL